MTATRPDRSPRVLLVSHHYPPHLGGIENVVRQEAAHLARRGADVTVLTSGPRPGAPGTGRAGERADDERADGDAVRVVRVPAWHGVEERAGIPFPVLAPALLPAAVRWARWADVVHVHDCLYMTSWAAGLAAALTRTPHVVTQHVAVVDHPSPFVGLVQRAVYAAAGRRLLSRAGRVVVVNDGVGAFAVGHGARRGALRHVPNGVDTEFFRPAASAGERERVRDRYRLPRDRVLVLFVGRLVRKKGWELLLAAADPAYELVFAGDGDGSALGGRSGVHGLGALPPAALAELYRACDVFALPSTAEGFPLSVQEAMASGLPVVTSDDPGYAPYGLDRDRVALLPREVPALRDTLSSLARDRARRERMAAYSRRYAAAALAWEGHTDALLRLYEDVRREHGRTAPRARTGGPRGAAYRGSGPR